MGDPTLDEGALLAEWTAFAERRGGTCRCIRDPDRTWLRLELRFCLEGCEVGLEWEDQGPWQAEARGRASRVQAFSVLPRGPMEALLSWFRKGTAGFSDPGLRRQHEVDGPGGAPLVALLERPAFRETFEALSPAYLVLMPEGEGFRLKLIPGPRAGFPEWAPGILGFLEDLVGRLRQARVLD